MLAKLARAMSTKKTPVQGILGSAVYLLLNQILKQRTRRLDNEDVSLAITPLMIVPRETLKRMLEKNKELEEMVKTNTEKEEENNKRLKMKQDTIEDLRRRLEEL